jgi:4-amino-4-deoxy-L-arabinose transferase-like glycosyltransferase
MQSAPAEAKAPAIPRPQALLALLALLLLCWLSFFNGLGQLGLTDKTEALFVEVGRQMLLRHDAVTPWWNGQTFFDYPVWGYWMVAGSFRLFGISEWAARLPSALAASAVVLAAFGLLLAWSTPQPGQAPEPRRQRWGRALLASGVLATSPGWIGWGRVATTDMFLSSAITLALFSFLLAHRLAEHPAASRLGRVGFALFAAIAVLAKGPVGLLLPGLVIVVFLSLTGQWARWWRPGSLLAMAALFAGVCLPWYAAATRANGSAFLDAFLGFSNVQRFTSVLYSHPGPPWFYLPWILLLLLPWSLFLPAALASLRFWRWSRWRQAAADPSLELPLFLLLWLVLIVAFFSAAATKLPGYILPALPAASLLVALWWQPLPGRTPAGSRSLVWSGGADALLLAVLAVAAAIAPRWAANDPAHPGFALALTASGLPLRLSLLLALSALAVLWLLLRPRHRPWLWLPNLAGFLAILALVIAPLAPLLDRERQLPIRQLARAARELGRSGEPLWVIGTKRYSVLFYGEPTAHFLDGRRAIRRSIRQEPASLGLTPTSISVRLLGDRSDLESLQIPATAVQRLMRRDQQELWRVRREDLGS